MSTLTWLLITSTYLHIIIRHVVLFTVMEHAINLKKKVHI